MTPASPDGPPPDTAPATTPTTPPAPPAFDAAACGAFLEALRGRDAPGCIQLQMFGCYKDRRNRIVPADRKSIVYAGWYDNHSAVVCDAEKAAGVSVYVALNPVKPEFLSVIRNDLAPCQAAAQVGDILSIENLFIDVDPNRPIQAKISATAAERALALACRDTILADHPAIARAAVWGCSGNGGYILARLPSYPNDEDHRQLVATALDILAAMYGRQAKRHGENPPVWVDTGTANPNRIMCLPGTVKCKGVATAERPWRPVTLDSGPAGREAGATLDLRAWVEENRHRGGGKAKGGGGGTNVNGHGHAGGHGPGKNGDPAGGGGRPDAVERARRYVASFPGAVSGEKGSPRTLEIACRLFEDFDLSVAQAWPILVDYNAKCDPAWSEAELRHKLEDADKKVTVRGKKLNEDRPGYIPNGHAGPAQAINGAAGNPAPLEIDHDYVAPELEADPARLARLFLARRHAHSDGYTLRYWKEEWLQWAAGAFRPITTNEIRAEVFAIIDAEFDRLHQIQLMLRKDRKATATKEDRPASKHLATNKLVGDVVLAVSSIVLLPSDTVKSQPEWICNSHPDWAAPEVLPTRNALIHLQSKVAGVGHRVAPTPGYFVPYALDYDYEPDAPPPADWLAFLAQLWPDDPQSVAALQEWFGYHLTTDTNLQKILLMVGPPRSGKGTIARILKGVIGAENVEGLNTDDFSLTFGLQPLIGKLSCIFSDIRITPKTDLGAISERLLRISGEDHITIHRKHTTSWKGTLPTRFTMISNEIPRILDASGALPTRFIILRLTESFEGREDITLTDKLMRQLPGILNWAIEGWKNLRARRRFLQPDSAADYIQDMKDLASPIGAFIREEITIGAGLETTINDAFARWKSWCHEQGQEHIGRKDTFGKDIRAVLPSLVTKQVRRGGKPVRTFMGFGLNPEPKPEESELAKWLLEYLQSCNGQCLVRNALDAAVTRSLIPPDATKEQLRPFWSACNALRTATVTRSDGKYLELPGSADGSYQLPTESLQDEEVYDEDPVDFDNAYVP